MVKIFDIKQARSCREVPLGPNDWQVIDGLLVDGIVEQRAADNTLINIQGSGYDSKHNLGYIACKDPASELWVKKLILSIPGGNYRAWARGKKPVLPESRLCRVFLPHRFDKLSDDGALAELCSRNPNLNPNTTRIKQSEQVQGGEPSTWRWTSHPTLLPSPMDTSLLS